MNWRDEVKAATDARRAGLALGLSAGRMGSLSPCPFCQEENRGNGDARGPIGSKRDGARWHCWRCNEGGDVLDLVAGRVLGKSSRGISSDEWSQIRQFCASAGWCEPGRDAPDLSESPIVSRGVPSPSGGGSLRRGGESPSEARGGRSPFEWSPSLADECERALWTPDGARALAYLREGRGFSESTIRAFRLGALLVGEGETWISIPLRDEDGRVVNVRFRRLPSDDASGPKYRVCAGRPLPLYNAERLGDDDPIVCEGELDVVALFEYGFVASVVSGTGGAGTWRDEWLDLLEPSTSILLAYDDDTAGDKGATALAERLGAYRCARVRLPRNDAGACLADGVDREVVAKAIAGASSMLGVEVCGVGEWAADIDRIAENPEELVGRPTGSERLDEAIGGLRPGLIVLSGETGQGKTTFATWLLAMQARMGVPTLLTSMEQSPVGTVQKLLRGQIGGDWLAVEARERRAAMAALSELPLEILKHRGNIGRDALLDAIRFSVRRRGVRNVLIDHLGFVIDPEADDERKEIESIVRELSIFAEHEGVTVVLICHPSNMHVAQKRRVSLSDLKGASAIRQDAHEVWIVEAAKPTSQRVYPASWIHFDKVRSDYGASGASVLLAFDPLATTYADSWGETPSGQRGVTLVQATKPGAGKPRDERRDGAAGSGGSLSRAGKEAASGR